MSTTSSEQFLKQLYGIGPAHQSPKVTTGDPAFHPHGEGVASWLDRMWGIRFPRRERRAA